MTPEAPLFIGELLSNHFGESVVVAILAGVVLLRFRRYRAVAAAGAGAAGSAATVAVAVAVSLMGLVALGYWDPPVSEITGDALGVGRAAYDTIGGPIVDWVVQWLDGVAGAS